MIDEDGVDVGPTRGELARHLGNAVVDALYEFLREHDLSIATRDDLATTVPTEGGEDA